MRTIAIALLLAATSANAGNAFDTAEDAIEYRKAAFGLIKENFADMGAMLKKKKPMDTAAFAERAQHLSLLAPIPFNGFKTPGSEAGDTGALPKVWKDWDGFQAKASTFQQATAHLAQVSQDGDAKAIAGAFGQVGKACKGCHDNYKAD